MSNIVTPSSNKANFSSPNAYKKAHQAASHIAAKNNMYPTSLASMLPAMLKSEDPRIVCVAMQHQYILQHNKAMSRTQLKKLRQKLNIL